ncbi:hypothetical protein RN001_003512 [Aquatica leii]|uniref:Myb/SANT-like DNA-binding domain-containing protein n=1 Tax=Aquatica leii TaxID=1421715 RepID=A0AAN7PR70_9COLE|nr:hypothetical protein RN001_003512 [Aquatica leii]
MLIILYSHRIVNKMRAKAYTYSFDHLQNKWKSLMRTYKSIKDHHNKTGTNRKSLPYYDLMDEILSDNPTIVPPLLMTNGIVEQTTSDAIDKEHVVLQQKNKKRKAKNINELIVQDESNSDTETDTFYINKINNGSHEDWHKELQVNNVKFKVN